MTFSGEESYDPEGDNLYYVWDINCDGSIDTQGEYVKEITYTFNSAGDFLILLREIENTRKMAKTMETRLYVIIISALSVLLFLFFLLPLPTFSISVIESKCPSSFNIFSENVMWVASGYLVDLTKETVNAMGCHSYPIIEEVSEYINEHADELLPEGVSGKIFLRKSKVYVLSVTDRTKEIVLEIYDLLVEKGLVEGGKTDFPDIIRTISNENIYNKVKFPPEYPAGTFFAKVSEMEIPNPFLKRCKSGGLSRFLFPCQEKIKIKKIDVSTSLVKTVSDIDVWRNSLILILDGIIFLYREDLDCKVSHLAGYYLCQIGKKYGDPIYPLLVSASSLQGNERPMLISENEIAVGNKIFRVSDGRIFTTELDIKPVSVIGVNYIGVKDGRYYVVNRRERRYYPLSADIKNLSFAEDERGRLYAQYIGGDGCIAKIFKVMEGTFVPFVKIVLCNRKIVKGWGEK